MEGYDPVFYRSCWLKKRSAEGGPLQEVGFRKGLFSGVVPRGEEADGDDGWELLQRVLGQFGDI